MKGKTYQKKTMQQPNHTCTDQPGEIEKSGNSQNNKQELKNQAHDQQTFTIKRSGQIIRKLERLFCY